MFSVVVVFICMYIYGYNNVYAINRPTSSKAVLCHWNKIFAFFEFFRSFFSNNLLLLLCDIVIMFRLILSFCSHISLSLSFSYFSQFLFLLMLGVYHLIISMCNIVNISVHIIGCCCLLLVHWWEGESMNCARKWKRARDRERARSNEIWKAGKTVWIVHVEKHVVHVEVYTMENNFQALA